MWVEKSAQGDGPVVWKTRPIPGSIGKKTEAFLNVVLAISAGNVYRIDVGE